MPFKNNLPQDDLEHLKNRLCDLSKERSLLFLRCLKRVEWKDERNAQSGFYSCSRRSYDKIQNVSANESVELVKFTAVLNGNSESSETFLVFSKSVHPSKEVINKLLEQVEDEEEQQRIQQSADKSQPIEVAFKLQDDRITTMDDNCVLFAYLPTQKETHLKFLIQARYQTTPARDNIPKPSENPWNEWLVQETADFLPEILEQLKASDLLEPAFFNILPLKAEVENEFKPIAEALQKAMQERELVPIQSGGHAKAGSVSHINSNGIAVLHRYAKAQNVYFPHTEILRQLMGNNWKHSESNWLHPEIRDTQEFRRCFKVMQEANVKTVEVSRVLDWLEERGSDWFKGRSNEWLRVLYIYLNQQGSQLDRIKKLPLIRLENGQHMCASESVFFPPETDKEREEVAPFLNELPILQSALLEGEEGNDFKAFLAKLGVKGLDPEEMIDKWILPQYSRRDKPSTEQNLLHVRYIFKVWDKLDEYKHRPLKEKIRGASILRVYRSGQPETFNFLAPCKAYLPEVYTGDADLETYFSAYNRDIWFVDDAYLEDKSDVKAWFQFLKAIGSMNTPQVFPESLSVNDGNPQEFHKRNIKKEYALPKYEHTIKDFRFHGLSKVLHEISKHGKENLSRVLWCLLVKVVKRFPSEERRNTFFKDFFQGTYSWFYNTNKSKKFDATFYRQLKSTAWLPDEQGNLHRPSECFAPTSDNRRLLGDSVPYLHPDFDISTEPAKWLADKLDMRLKPDRESVLNYLQKLSSTEVSVEKVKPLYRFLRSVVEDTQLHKKFKKESLIFAPNPEPSWWRTGEVFWKDESEVFKSDRGYLKMHYPETLKPFFIALGVSEQASQQDYALGIQEITTTKQAGDEKVRERVQSFYKCLRAWSVDKEIYDSKCWIGKKGEKWGFFTRQELVLKDHPHIGGIFEGEVPFWAFDDDLLNLAQGLKVERCSQAQVEFHPEGNQEEDTDWSKKMEELRPYIYAFLNSPLLSEEAGILMLPEELREKCVKFLTNCSVRRVKELRVTYELKGTSVTDSNPRQSFLDITSQPAKLWLGLKEDEDDYAELIDDALQDYFGIKELGRFVEDLLKKDLDKVRSNWKRKGLQTKLLDEDPKDDVKRQIEDLDEQLPDELNSENTDPLVDESDLKVPTDSEMSTTDNEGSDSLTDRVHESAHHLFVGEDDDSRTDGPEIETRIDSRTIEIDKSDNDSTSDKSESPTNLASDVINISSPDTQLSTNTGSGGTHNVGRGSESETLTAHEDPETGNENGYSTENKSETASYQPGPGGSRTRSRKSKGINTPNRNRRTGHSSAHSGGTEDDTHVDETGTSPHAKKEIERIGMEHARRYEEEQGCTVEDVSTKNLGFDLRSTTPNGEVRCIEVKARAERSLVVLTSNEWQTADRLKNIYFLYVVLNATTQPELYIIRNPTDKVAVDERYDVRYQVPLSEIAEHGKLV